RPSERAREGIRRRWQRDRRFYLLELVERCLAVFVEIGVGDILGAPLDDLYAGRDGGEEPMVAVDRGLYLRPAPRRHREAIKTVLGRAVVEGRARGQAPPERDLARWVARPSGRALGDGALDIERIAAVDHPRQIRVRRWRERLSPRLRVR